jgi:hypothetical protein
VSILALCPSRGRPQAARETLASFEATRRDKGSRLVFVVDRDDPTLPDYPAEHTHVVPVTGCMGDALRAATVPAVLRDATSVGMIGDDNRFRTPGWDVLFDVHLTQNLGICYGDDGFQHQRLPTAWWVSRPLVDAFGLAPKGLRHLYMDNWWKSLGQGAGCLRYFPEVSIEHLHPHVTEGPNWLQSARSDATYARGNSRMNIRNDRESFELWERKGRKEDVRRARVIVGGGSDRRKVLADWHHPALWESLAILFEDRFGWELYSMAGEDWQQHGWTMSSGPPISWSAAEYLSLKGAKPVGDHWERVEREYPKRPRKMVTPDQAFGMSWDFILGSVSDHQRTFAALADRLGARFIHQVGNAKHYIDLGVRQTILASSNVKLRSRYPHVIYHQEFDRGVFAPSPVTHPCSVTSLMLRLDWTSCDYRWLAAAPGIRWSSPGGQDPNARDYLAPMSKVAERIRESGWVWHDKKVGDGFGHTLHNAAAMGRPIIGHASHYRGMLGEPFWDDLKTCIDLDKHEPREALRLIRAISGDPDWHGEMSANIADRFDQLVDFDAEAARIRTLLTS